MITEITKEQADKMSEYVRAGLKIGCSTEAINVGALAPIARDIYVEILKIKAPAFVIVARGPSDGFRASIIWSAGDQSFIAVDKDNPGVHRIDSPKLSRLYKAYVEKHGKQNFVWPYLDGQYWASWFANYDYVQEVLGVKLDVKLYALLKSTINYGLWYTLTDACIVTERPLAISMVNGKLHNDKEPAVVYGDGTKVWALNGVRVPEKLVTTPRHKMKSREFADISNAEIRREFVRKLGVEKLCEDLGAKVIDALSYSNANKDIRKWMVRNFGDVVNQKPDAPIYELLAVDLKGTTGVWPYLKMLNPSIGVWHMECVDKKCRTVMEALEFRNGFAGLPEIMT